jgi:signal transduction histidine kinase
MIGPSTERRGVPGGLRAQLLIGLCLLLAVGFGLVAVVADHAINRQRSGPAQKSGSAQKQAQLDNPAKTTSAPVVGDKFTDTRKLLLVYLGLDAFFILLVGYAFFTYVVMRPLRAIGVASERAARGDLASPIGVLPPNEFGQVGRQFNQMLAELRKNRGQLEERLDELDLANQKLRQTRDSLIRSEKLASVGQLAAGVAHEVGNPLAAISGYLELLDEGDLDEEMTSDVLTRSQQQVDRMRDIIRDLLDYSRDDAEAAVEAVSLPGCVDEAISLVQAQPKSRSVTIAAKFADDLAPVSAVDSQVVQILVNLLINAVDAIAADQQTNEPGSITIKAIHHQEAGQVVVSVRDNGPGIPAEALQRVFDPFFTTKDPGEGTGLGLAICLRIMRRLGGDIHVDSTEGQGTVFELNFPAAA